VRTIRRLVPSTVIALLLAAPALAAEPEPGVGTDWIDSIHFSDDPLLDDASHRQALTGRGGSGLVTPLRDENGVWQVCRDIVLTR
jgi:hypothetical protein